MSPTPDNDQHRRERPVRSSKVSSYGPHPFKPDEPPLVTFEVVRLVSPAARELATEQARVIMEVIQWLVDAQVQESRTHSPPPRRR